MSLKMGQNIYIPFSIDQTDTLAGTSAEIVAPADGFVSELQVVVQAAVGTGGTVKVVNDDGDDVTGATVTVADAAAKGTVYEATATISSATRQVSKGDRIQVVPDAAFTTSGAVNGVLTFNTAH